MLPARAEVEPSRYCSYTPYFVRMNSPHRL